MRKIVLLIVALILLFCEQGTAKPKTKSQPKKDITVSLVEDNGGGGESTTCTATTLFVNANATGLDNGLSWTDAYKNLQDALANTCEAVTQIWVAKGTYYPDEGAGLTDNGSFQSFKMKNGIAIYGGFAGGESNVEQRNWQTNITKLSGDLLQNDGPAFSNYTDNAWHVVLNGGQIISTAILDGFTITSGQTSDRDEVNKVGGGMFNFNSSPTITNCLFTNNLGFSGAGIYNSNSNPVVSNCNFENNKSLGEGGGVLNELSSPSFTRCNFSGNSATNGAGVTNNESSAHFTNCNFADNNADNGGAMFNSNSSPVITNTRFFKNAALQNGNALYNYGGAPILTNCTISGNAIFSVFVIFNTGNSSVTFINSIIWGNGPTFDFFSNPGSSVSVTYSISSVAGAGNINTDPLFVNLNAGDLRLKLNSPASNTGNNAANNELYDLDGNPRKVGVIDMGAYESACAGPVLFVKNSAVGANNGSSWSDAYTSLQDALSNTSSCITEIWVAKGIYYPDEGTGADNNRNATFIMKNNIGIYGGFAGTESLRSQRNWVSNVTTLSGDIDQNDGADFANNGGNSVHVIFNNYNWLTATAILDGFTITGGNANLNRLVESGSDGGGMCNLNAAPSIKNCIFSGNYAANYGAGIFNFHAPASVTNCVFLGNGSSSIGGAVTNTYTPVTLTNCSFFGNPSGAVRTLETTSNLVNCILWSNGGAEISNEQNQNGSTTVTSSIVKGGYTGAGNLNLNPLFINPASGNLRLQPGSPAIDAGNNDAVTTATDLDGNARIVNATNKGSAIVDMGAYELPSGCINFEQWVLDADKDGFYTGDPINACTSPGSGYVVKATQQANDCDDSDPSIYYVGRAYVDKDGDGITAQVTICRGAYSLPQNGLDCDDADPAKYRGLFVYTDNDGDGYTVGNQIFMCLGDKPPDGYTINSSGADCNDNDATVPKLFYHDEDGDGFTLTGELLCTSILPTGWVTTPSEKVDCNDQDKSVNSAILCWPDDDGDGFGYDIRVHDPRFTSFCFELGIDYESLFVIALYGGGCDITNIPTKLPKFFCLKTPPPGWSLDNTDCNDADVTVHAPVQYYVDGDNDGFGSTVSAMLCSANAPPGYSTNNTDCNDADATKGAPVQYYVDGDHDGFGSTVPAMLCSATAPLGYSTNNTDCNDGDASIHVSQVYYLDADKDGYGNAAKTITVCFLTPPLNYVTNNLDCNDGNPAVSPAAAEVCGNKIDDNCNGVVDENVCYACLNATNLRTSGITGNSAQISWNATANPAQWQLQYKTTNKGTKWMDVLLTGNLRTYKLTPLSSNQNYQVQIRAKCGNTWTSYSAAVGFKTTTVSLSRPISADENTDGALEILKLHPNPTTGKFMLELKVGYRSNSKAQIQLIDMLGRAVYLEDTKMHNGFLQKTISVSSALAHGTYLVKVVVNDKIYKAQVVYQK